MAVNPNFTNANAGTPYASGGVPPTSNLLVASIQFTPALAGNPTDSDTVGQGFNPYDGTNICSIVQKSTENLGPLLMGGSAIVQQAGNGPSTALYRMFYNPEGIIWEQANTGTSFPMMAINPNTQTQNLFNLSTINAGGNTANAISLMSSLKGTFPTSFA